MSLALAWILARSLRGRILRAARMLKRPKYLVGLVVGIGWMLFWLGPSLGGGGAIRFAGTVLPELSGDVRGILVRVVAAAIALWFSVTWLVPLGRTRLGFREAELHFLLPAPIPRRQLVGYGVLRAQPGILITTCVFTVVLGPGSLADRLRLGVGFWLLLTTWDLVSKARGLFLLRQREVGRERARVRWAVVLAVVAGFWSGVGPWVFAAVRAAGSAVLGAIERGDARSIDWPGLAASVEPPVAARWLLQPLVWALGPVVAGDATRFWLALGPAVVLMLAVREVVVRSPARFEESALARARRETERRSPTRAYRRLSRRARRGRPFALAPGASPAVAILWKNLTKVTRRPLAGWAAAGAALCLAAAVVPAVTGHVAAVASTVAILGAFLLGLPPVVSGTMWINDLRSELGSLDLVRTWPIAPSRLVLAEVAAPAVLSTMACALGAGLVAAAAASVRLKHLATGAADVEGFALVDSSVLGVPGDVFLWLLVAGVLPVAAATAFFSSAVQNLIALWFPAWVPRERKTGGMSAFGSQMLFMWALTFAVLLAAIPGALLLGTIAVLQWWLGIPWHALELPPAGLLVAAPMTAGTWFVVRAAAHLWERLDPSAEILES